MWSFRPSRNFFRNYYLYLCLDQSPGPNRLHGEICRAGLSLPRPLWKGVSEAPSGQRTACIYGPVPPTGAASQPGLWHPLLTWLKVVVRVLSGECLSRAGPSFCLQSSWIRLRHSGWQVNLQSRGRESKGPGVR